MYAFKQVLLADELCSEEEFLDISANLKKVSSGKWPDDGKIVDHYCDIWMHDFTKRMYAALVSFTDQYHNTCEIDPTVELKLFRNNSEGEAMSLNHFQQMS